MTFTMKKLVLGTIVLATAALSQNNIFAGRQESDSNDLRVLRTTKTIASGCSGRQPAGYQCIQTIRTYSDGTSTRSLGWERGAAQTPARPTRAENQ